MLGADLGYDVLTVLRVGSMLVFIAVFFGVIVWLLLPRGKRHSEDAAMIPLRDDPPSRGAPPRRDATASRDDRPEDRP